MRNANFMGELLLYWPSKIFLPFRQWMPMGERFRGFKRIWVLCFGFVLKHFSYHALASMLIALCGCLIHYINPRKRDCHQLPKWGRLKVHGAPCVVLVINDNPYGLMFALRYFCRFVHRHHFGSMCWIQEEDHRRNQGVCPICFRWR